MARMSGDAAGLGVILDLVAGTLRLRPYVFAFLAGYLVVAARDVGLRRALLWLGWGSCVALAAEYMSTRVGLPFGLYQYTGGTVGQELFIANVPVFSTLSFPFLAYAAWALMRWVNGRGRDIATVLGAGVLMTLLDVVIDPLAVRGDRWFLGNLFFYAEGGWYFGVPLSNFAGWALVGWAIVGGMVWTRFLGFERRPSTVRYGSPHGGAALYYAILLFNLAIAVWIGELVIVAVGVGIHVAVGIALLHFGRVARAGEQAARAPGVEPVES
jgi:uncharacterized membrane protein